MNKTLIKNFAIDARARLIQMAIDNAGLVGIAKDKIDSPVQKGAGFEIYKTLAGTEHTISGAEIKQRENLVNRIKKDGFENVMEAAAYTWFNRIIAIRYMEVNDYLPARVRVLSSETAGKKEPDIITQAPDNVDLNFTEAEKQQIRELKSKQKMDEAFQFLFIKQCNELNKILPKLFERTSSGELDYTELLFSLSFIQSDGVVARLLEIDEEDFKDQVQIIGWMYQYYNTELKDDTFAKLKKNVKITKERIPAATQLFTPDWIVRYMVENSLGRLYIEHQKQIGTVVEPVETTIAQAMGWKYYLPQAEQTEEVQKKLDEIRSEQMATGGFNLETIKVLDPCMGSGHILVYAFDVLIQMYKNAGYNERDAAQKIMQNNIFGLDIDDRAAQFTYFALMMKGRQYDRRFFERNIEPNTYAIQESNGISEKAISTVIEQIASVIEQTASVIEPVEMTIAKSLVQIFCDAKEFGSIIDVPALDYDSLKNTLIAWKQNHEATLENGLIETDVDALLPLIEIAKVMSAKYDVVVTNPPYMGASGMGERLSNFVKKNYEDSKSDLFAVFIEKCSGYAKKTGFISMITQHAWMFLSSYEKLRAKLNARTTLNMAHLGARAFDEIGGEVVQTTAFVTLNSCIENYKGTYKRLVDFAGEAEKEAAFADEKNTYYAQQENFAKIPGMPVAYWVSENVYNAFMLNNIKSIADAKVGIGSGNTDYFLKLWFEIPIYDITFGANSSMKNNLKFVPINKGGTFRKWYGNNEYIINWENDGLELKNYSDSRGNKLSYPRNLDYQLRKSITWGDITSGDSSFRFSEGGYFFSDVGNSLFVHNEDFLYYVLAFANSTVLKAFSKLINQTMHFKPGNMEKMPYVYNKIEKSKIDILVKQNISLSKSDWDSFETSWDFKKHPLI